jgi:pyruvate kinase
MNLIEQGMACARINCAHDSPERWTSIIEHLGRAQERCGRSIRILVDLARV